MRELEQALREELQEYEEQYALLISKQEIVWSSRALLCALGCDAAAVGSFQEALLSKLLWVNGIPAINLPLPTLFPLLWMPEEIHYLGFKVHAGTTVSFCTQLLLKKRDGYTLVALREMR